MSLFIVKFVSEDDEYSWDDGANYVESNSLRNAVDKAEKLKGEEVVSIKKTNNTLIG